MPKLVPLFAAEGSARTGEEQFFNRIKALSLQALEKSTVLTVDGKNFNPCCTCFTRYDFACHDERFLIGKCNILLRMDRFHRRFKPGKAHHRRDDKRRIAVCRSIDKSLTPARELCLPMITCL